MKINPIAADLGKSWALHALFLGGFISATQPTLLRRPTLLISVDSHQGSTQTMARHSPPHRVAPSKKAIVEKKSLPTALTRASSVSGVPATNTAHDATPYLILVRSKIESALHYPLALQRRGVEGRVLLKLVLDEEGHVNETSVARTSGNADLDRLAVQAARDAMPFPKTEMGKLSLSLPVEFKSRF